MGVSSELFLLQQKLSKSEKRYLTLQMNAGGKEKNYVQVFEAIESLNEYDEEKLKKKLGKDLAKQLPVLKSKLYYQLLRHMQSFYYESNRRTEVNNHIRSVRFLYDRGLFTQAEKLAIKAREMAAKYEFFSEHQELLNLNIRINYELHTLEKSMPLFEEQKELMRKMANMLEYEQLITESLQIQLKSLVIHSPEKLKKLKAMLKLPVMQKQEMVLSYRAGEAFYLVQSICHRILNNMDKSIKAREQRVQWMEKHPHMIAEEPKAYIGALTNYCLGQLAGKRFEVLDLLTKTLKMPEQLNIPMHDEIHLHVFRVMKNTELDLYLMRGDYAEAEKLVPEIENYFKLKQAQISPMALLPFYYLFARAYFGTGNYSKSTYYINLALAFSEKETRSDFLILARLHSLLLYYETEKTELLESRIRSLYGQLRKQQSLSKLEKILLEFLRSNKGNEKGKPTKERLQAVYDKVMSVYADPDETAKFHHTDIASWLYAKIHDVSLKEAKRRFFENYVASE